MVAMLCSTCGAWARSVPHMLRVPCAGRATGTGRRAISSFAAGVLPNSVLHVRPARDEPS
eukprot:12919331-Prorocentrum_lima.AAC.1